jgi:hypothetical protein
MIDNLVFPPRFVGYGAYNLAFDNKLGLKDKETFFQHVQSRAPAVNLIKVICFRRATLEGLEDISYDANGVPIGRTQPLYKANRTINEGFLNNLLNLVRVAKPLGFWIQVCIFHEQAIRADSNGNFEEPENLPPILNPTLDSMGKTNCERLTNFFNIVDPNRLKLQLDLARAIAGKLRMETNVLFEIANEVRIQGCSADANKAGDCKIVPWLNAVSEAMLSAIFWDFLPDGTSGIRSNEEIFFSLKRPANGCSEQRFRPTFFDFHAGQWGASETNDDYIAAMESAKNRVLMNYMPPGSTKAFLIINDDGMNWDQETPQQKIDHARLINKWATLAFQKGLHYASKQQYPPGQPWDDNALGALQQAAASVR